MIESLNTSLLIDKYKYYDSQVLKFMKVVVFDDVINGIVEFDRI